MFRNEQFIYWLLKIHTHNLFYCTLIGSNKCIINEDVSTRSHQKYFLIVKKKLTQNNKLLFCKKTIFIVVQELCKKIKKKQLNNSDLSHEQWATEIFFALNL